MVHQLPCLQAMCRHAAVQCGNVLAAYRLIPLVMYNPLLQMRPQHHLSRHIPHLVCQGEVSSYWTNRSALKQLPAAPVPTKSNTRCYDARQQTP